MLNYIHKQPSYQLGSVSYSPLLQTLNRLAAVDSAFSISAKNLSDAINNKEFDNHSDSFHTRFSLDETDSQYSLSIELPGYSSKEVKVEVEDYILLVEASNDKKGKTNRKIVLWEGIDFNKISGEMKDGILVVALPKIEQVKPKKIEIK